jgi:predicted  nucleic acid-binding Zn-ribbon protein
MGSCYDLAYDDDHYPGGSSLSSSKPKLDPKKFKEILETINEIKEDLKEDELEDEFCFYKVQIKKLKKKIKGLEKNIGLLQKENETLKNRVYKMEIEISELRKLVLKK